MGPLKGRPRRRSRRHAASSRGFTLLEMLVVVVLIAMLAGVVSISTRPDPHQALLRQAQRVALLLRLAGQESRLRHAPIDWEADLQGYRFVSEQDGQRTTIGADEVLRERAWEPPLTQLAVTDLASGLARGVAAGQSQAVRVSAAREWVQPAWRLYLANDAASVSLQFDAHGNATILQ